MPINLSADRKAQLITSIRSFYETELDEKISPFRAEQLLDFFLRTIGSAIYNQAVQDAQAYMQSKLDDLDGEVYASDVF